MGCSGVVYASGFVCRWYKALCFPSSCGMLVYNDDTSMDASKHFSGIFVVSISLRKSVESLRYEGSFFMCGCNQRSTNWDMGSVMLLQLDTIGLIPIGVLWTFFKK